MTITMKADGWDEKNKLAFDKAEDAAAFANQIQDNKISKEALKFMENSPALRNIYLNPELTAHQKKIQALPIINNFRKERSNLEKELRKQEEILALIKKQKQAWIQLKEWCEQDTFILEKNDCSRLHKLISEFKHDRIAFENEKVDKKDAHLLWEGVHTFVVQHDWASAFKNAQDYVDGDIRLPYPISAFEFRISNKNIVVLAVQIPEDLPSLALQAFVEINNVWLCLEEQARELKPFHFAWEQIRAISIALEAEAAEKNLVRASSSLNKKRIESGKLPLYDYHIVSLARREYSKFSGGGTHRSPRLHFRRGHWRQYQNHKTWIKWMLVGNPDLGFVDKEYRL